jgi:hypothetical protein
MKKLKVSQFNIVMIIVLGVLIWPLTAAAGDFDGSTPLVCAVIDAVECGPRANCEERTPEDINLVRFFRIDFNKGVISGMGQGDSARSTKIERTEEVDGKLILQGAEEAREGVRDGVGWTLALSKDTGELVGTASGDQAAFIVFCNCTPD